VCKYVTSPSCARGTTKRTGRNHHRQSIDLSHKENETIRVVVVVVSTTIKNHGFDSINPKPKQRRALTFGNELYVSDGR
jgi:hypothetical protein